VTASDVAIGALQNYSHMHEAAAGFHIISAHDLTEAWGLLCMGIDMFLSN